VGSKPTLLLTIKLNTMQKLEKHVAEIIFISIFAIACLTGCTSANSQEPQDQADYYMNNDCENCDEID